jgi:electron transfer flavoprotein alpha subunit
VTVFCLVELEAGEVAEASLRALALARGLAAGTGVTAVAFAAAPCDAAALGTELAAYGAAEVCAVSGIDGYAPQAWARVLAGLLAADGDGDSGGDGGASPGLSRPAVVAAGTERGNEVLAHLGAITGLPMAANCVAAEPGPGGLSLVRQRWAGLLLEEAVLDAPAALLTVAADAVAGDAVAADAVTADAVTGGAVTGGAVSGRPAAAVVHELAATAGEADLVVRAAESPDAGGGASLATARVVVGGGRGVGSADGFAALDELAALLGGVVGVSRVVTSEGWRPHAMQVGQTGTKISPDLYLACGISGAIQHFAGCSGAKHIIAINTDPSAPMMTRADYAVVGDLHEVLPELIKTLKARS